MKTVKLKTLPLLRYFTTESTRLQPAAAAESIPTDPAVLHRVCSILFQQKNLPESRLHESLSATGFTLTRHLFLRVCNQFPRSWRPLYGLYTYSLTRPDFQHTPETLHRVADSAAKALNVDLLCHLLHDIGRRGFAGDATFRIAVPTLAGARELTKCVRFFHLMNRYGVPYSVENLNRSVFRLCRLKLVGEASFVVKKLKGSIEPDSKTYGLLVKGFCDSGDMVEASKAWNHMVRAGLEPGVVAVEAMITTFFKQNRFGEGMKVFEMMRTRRARDLKGSTYKIVVDWMCKRDEVDRAYLVFDEMLGRGFSADNPTLAALICGLVTKNRVDEARRVLEGIKSPDTGVFHGMMRGFLKQRRVEEATEVFREMIRRGCEPIMHTYIMLLRGHMGRWGRKGPRDVESKEVFDAVFVGGLVKAGKHLEATKFVERAMEKDVHVPKFDYNKFLYYHSNEDGAVMFEGIGKKLREAGMVDLADIFQRYGQKMTTRLRRIDRRKES